MTLLNCFLLCLFQFCNFKVESLGDVSMNYNLIGNSYEGLCFNFIMLEVGGLSGVLIL
jgi:hypothetical protein